MGEKPAARDAVPGRIAVLIPVYNDWAAAARLLMDLDGALQGLPDEIRVLLIDDGSVESPEPSSFSGPYEQIATLRMLHLRRNLGHQRAIAVGLPFVYEKMAVDAVLIMDGDGEDRPEDAVRLIECMRADKTERVVFAERRQRSESLIFRFCYHVYRVAHFVLTGIPVRVGNFSVVPRRQLSRLVAVSELWNHYAAGVFASRVPRATIPTSRGQRLDGKSTMDFVSLVMHGISAISVFSAIVGVRLLMASLVLFLSGLVALGVVLAMWWSGEGTVTAPLAYGAGFVLLFLSQLVVLASGLVFFVLRDRDGIGFLPLRDYGFFVESVQKVYPSDE